jgi:hypothetical protein
MDAAQMTCLSALGNRRTMSLMRYALIIALLSAACSGSSPTAPSPVAVTPPPVVVAPPVVAPPTNPLLSDPRFDRGFYEQFALGARDLGRTTTLRRQQRPPLFYIQTVDNTGAAIDPRTLDATAAALINTAPLWNGGMGIEGLTMGREAPTPPPCPFCAPLPDQVHRIAVVWDNTTTTSGQCARSDVGGNLITVFLRTAGCACLGLAVAPVVIKHELGHTMGYWHTDSVTDVMGAAGTPTCDLTPSAREQFHARVAYSLPQGSSVP